MAEHDSDGQRAPITQARSNGDNGQKAGTRRTKSEAGPETAPGSTGRARSSGQSTSGSSVTDPLSILETSGERRQQFVDKLYRALERKRAIERKRGPE
ncbi:MAG: hypothetical protein SVG88_08940 [Halobacteriales archaeon]|nr:hypothetical protein [Halobacteriales archaeon]